MAVWDGIEQMSQQLPPRESETAQHQRAKTEIAEACRRAGYEPRLEFVGDDWRADVLAALPGGGRIAFEVQWSPLTLEEALRRQQRYTRDGVRGCWFFRHPPPALQTPDPLRLRARRDLPLFPLLVSADLSFSVALNGRLLPLHAFAEALLRSQVRYCPAVRAGGRQRVRLAFFPVTCAACGKASHVYAAAGALVGACGAAFEPDAAALAGIPDVQATAARLAGERGYRFGGMRGDQFVCAHCGAAFEPQRVEMAAYGSARLALALHDPDSADGFTLDIRLNAPLFGKGAHWCIPGDAHFCCKER
jgi:hypothetical protein